MVHQFEVGYTNCERLLTAYLKWQKNTRRPICYSLNITHVPFSFTAWSFSYLTYWSTLNLLIEHKLKTENMKLVNQLVSVVYFLLFLY